ncbi:MAG: GAF domain-containing protein [Paracoccus sp.]|nr:GAF domain-containing protein [Paracoccus sp. (in: a-proteobacteria)]
MFESSKIESANILVDTDFFNNVVDSCRNMFDCKISLISVIDKDAQKQLHWAQAGLSSAKNEVKSLPLSHSICKKIITTGEPLIISDTRKDENYLSHPAVGAFKIRSYLGVPVKDDADECIAALCVVDTKARKWTKDDVRILQGFASGLSAQVQQLVSPGHDEPTEVNPDILNDAELNNIKVNISFQQDQNGVVTQLNADLSYCEVWEKMPDADGSKTFDLFDMCVPENIARLRTSFGIAAARESVWHQKWTIRCASGVEKQLSGVGHAKPLPGGFTLWHVLITASGTRNNTSYC